MSRKPIIAGNWKMNLLQSDARALYEGISSFVSNYSAVQLPSVVIAPVFTCLNQVKEIPCDCGCNGTKLAVAAQIVTGNHQGHIQAKFLLKWQKMQVVHISLSGTLKEDNIFQKQMK